MANYLWKSAIERLQKAPALGDRSVAFVFGNVENLGLSVVPLVAAKVYATNPYGEPGWWVIFMVALLAVAGLSLLTLNVLHGLRKLSEVPISKWLAIPLGVTYLFVAAFVWVLLTGAQGQ